jgi:hypothetical protein
MPNESEQSRIRVRRGCGLFEMVRTRRDFLKGMSIFWFLAMAGLSMKGCSRKRELPAESTIIRVSNSEAVDNTGGKDDVNLRASVIEEMVNEGIKQLTGKKRVEDAWSAIIPDPTKKMAIKVNCQITGIFTKGKIVKAVTDGIVARGVNPNNIVIYDLRDNGFIYAGLRKNLGEGIKAGTCDELGGFSWIQWFGFPLKKDRNRFCKVLAGEGEYGCDYLINMPVLKSLDGYSGVSISLKNHFGSISDCSNLHRKIHDSIAALNASELIVGKTRLILADGIFTSYKWVNGRSQEFVETTNQLLFGTDPVAIDYLGWMSIEHLRRRRGLTPVEPSPSFIERASQKYGLGNWSREKIRIIDV